MTAPFWPAPPHGGHRCRPTPPVVSVGVWGRICRWFNEEPGRR